MTNLLRPVLWAIMMATLHAHAAGTPPAPTASAVHTAAELAPVTTQPVPATPYPYYEWSNQAASPAPPDQCPADLAEIEVWCSNYSGKLAVTS